MCSCRGGTGAGRRVKTSGDYNVPPPSDAPLLVVQADAVHEVPEGAEYKLMVGEELRYFADHGPAFRAKQVDGGKLRRAS